MNCYTKYRRSHHFFLDVDKFDSFYQLSNLNLKVQLGPYVGHVTFLDYKEVSWDPTLVM